MSERTRECMRMDRIHAPTPSDWTMQQLHTAYIVDSRTLHLFSCTCVLLFVLFVLGNFGVVSVVRSSLDNGFYVMKLIDLTKLEPSVKQVRLKQ